MKNKVNSGTTLPWTNTTGATVLGGAIVRAGNILGVLVTDTANNALGTLDLEGVFTAAKVPGAVFAQGEKLLWDASAGAFDDSAATGGTGDVMGGAVAYLAGANGETTCTVKLTPGNTVLT
jgi:predicted RecA/RadA family phage recombinase